MESVKIWIFLSTLFCFSIVHNEGKSLVKLQTGVRSDAIVTSGFSSKPSENLFSEEQEEPGWMRWVHKQYKSSRPESPCFRTHYAILLKRELEGESNGDIEWFGQMTSSIGNKFGGFTSKVAKALDKICEVVKTVIPVIAAVCHVGQFQFCTSISEAPQELAEVLAPNNIDLNIPD